MRKLLLDPVTKMVVNAVEVKDDNWPAPKGFEYAPQHDADIGDTWDGAAWVERVHYVEPPKVLLPKLAIYAREQRDILLAASDFTQLDDNPKNTQAWKTYRQLLRDLSDQVGFPDNIAWPTPPTD